MEDEPLTPEEREDHGLDPEPQDGPGDLDDLPESDFEGYATDDVEVDVVDAGGVDGSELDSTVDSGGPEDE